MNDLVDAVEVALGQHDVGLERLRVCARLDVVIPHAEIQRRALDHPLILPVEPDARQPACAVLGSPFLDVDRVSTSQPHDVIADAVPLGLVFPVEQLDTEFCGVAAGDV